MRPEKMLRMTILLSSFALLTVLDILTTQIALGAGGIELNPLYYSLGNRLFYLLKIGFVLYVMAAIRFLPELKKLKLLVLVALVLVMSAVVSWNMLYLLGLPPL